MTLLMHVAGIVIIDSVQYAISIYIAHKTTHNNNTYMVFPSNFDLQAYNISNVYKCVQNVGWKNLTRSIRGPGAFILCLLT